MAKYPWLQFHSGDWLKDPKLSICSPATRGVWIDLVCAMHESDRSGELCGTSDQLARVARCSAVELTHALTELQTTGAADVTLRNEKVTVINRRMKREFKSSCNSRLRQSRFREKRRSNAGVTPYIPRNQETKNPQPPPGGGGERLLESKAYEIIRGLTRAHECFRKVADVAEMLRNNPENVVRDAFAEAERQKAGNPVAYASVIISKRAAERNSLPKTNGKVGYVDQ